MHRFSVHIDGLLVPGSWGCKVPCLAEMDDVVVCVSQSGELEGVMRVCEEFSAVSGLRVNFGESNLLVVGGESWAGDLQQSFRVVEDCIHVLGVWVGSVGCVVKNWGSHGLVAILNLP